MIEDLSTYVHLKDVGGQRLITVDMAKTSKNGRPPLTTTEALAQSYLSVVEVASLLRISTKTVRRKVCNGELKALKVSDRKVLIDSKGVRAMLRLTTADIEDSFSLKGGKSNSLTLEPSEDKAEAASITAEAAADDSPSLGEEERSYYTNAELCRKHNLNAATSYTFRQRYKIPCIDPKHPHCFDKRICDNAMALDMLRKGANIDRSQWYSCGDLKKLYGFNDAHIRRFAIRNKVRTCRYLGRRLLYNKVDWDAARENMKFAKADDVTESEVDTTLWYTSRELEERYGIKDAQVRRFAIVHHVKMCRRKGKRMYFKKDWDAERAKKPPTGKCRPARELSTEEE